jgi:hypothetical protein
MKFDSDKKFPPVPVGSTVRVPIPDVDKGRGDSRNILAIVMNVTEDGFYRIGTTQGILKQLYAISQFTVCRNNYIFNGNKVSLYFTSYLFSRAGWRWGPASENKIRVK